MEGRVPKIYRFFVFALFLCFSTLLSGKPLPCGMSLSELVAKERSRQIVPKGREIRIAAIIAAERNGEFMTLERIGNGANEKGTKGFAGGSIEEFDWDLQAGAIREFYEETGLMIDRHRLRYVGKLDYHGGDGRFYATHFFYLHLEDDEDPVIPQKEKTRLGAVRFVRLDQLPDKMFSTNTVVFEFFTRHGFENFPQIDLNAFAQELHEGHH